ncbi:MAG TPA: ATP-binding protein [Kofleriaceae bacterium]|nr:ATP-binding protein [Kofleriaceae bacterium]
MIAALVAIGLCAATALVTVWVMRRSLRQLTEATREIVRDPARRVPTISARGELRELGEWINALAEDGEARREALGRERTLLASVADGLTQGVIAIDGERKIEMLNDAARRMLGFQSSMVGEPLLELVRVPELRELIERERERDASSEVQLPHGGPRTLIRVARTYGRAGCVLLLEDVTNVRRLETVRRDFVANVSHELRTPVAVIRANAETLIAGAKDDPQIAARLIDGLHRNAERLARILADLLDLSRLDAGQYRLEMNTVPVRGVTEQSLTAVEPQAQQRGVEVSVDVPDAIAVRADPKALDQILVNLLDNGVKYTRPDGHVWVLARDVGDAVRIEVRDDGPGIAAKHRERVFERFYRADPSRSREAGGTGLGLSIVKHLVESMGGEVGVEPNAPSGSVFWLRLPKAKEAMAS